VTVVEKPSAVEIRGASKIFPTADEPVRALDDVYLTIGQNEFFTLLGPSGCGKTTLLRLIAGFDYPTSGQILLYGEDIATLPPYRRPVNTVFQNYALFPHMTVAQNIAFGLEMLRRPRAEINARVDEMLKLVRMEALRHRRISEISGGQQQRVALARALAPAPKVLLLDEPLSALDYKLRKDMQIELKRLQHETGITFIFVTHDQEEALTMSDRIAVMSAGRVLQVGSPRDIYDRPADRFVADFIGESNFLGGEVIATDGTHATIRLRAGPVIAAQLPDGYRPAGEVTVAVRPEHAAIAPLNDGAMMHGLIDQIVYFGTDTHYRLRLVSGESFIVRRQNRPDAPSQWAEGEKVGLVFAAGTAQVLKD